MKKWHKILILIHQLHGYFLSLVNLQRGDLIIRVTDDRIELDARLCKATLVAAKKSNGILKLMIADGPHVGIYIMS